MTRDFNWVPGIGDPTFGGWVTVVLYLLACLSCWKTAEVVLRRDLNGQSDSRVWLALSIAFFFLGINKQMDLQSAMTELGRMVAFSGGWYEQRRTVQIYFVNWRCRHMRGGYCSVAFLDQKISNSNMASSGRLDICTLLRTSPSGLFSSY